MDNIQDFEINSPRWLSLEDFEGEVWKQVVGYEERYKVSNYGRVKQLDNNGLSKYSLPRILKQYFPNNRGCYWFVDLYINGKSKHKRVHRLVAKAFLPNPNNLPEVNHKDENKQNPHLDNLEWCTRKYNANYGTMPKRMGEHIKRRKRESINNGNNGYLKHKEVHQYDLNGNYIASYYSQKEAEAQTGANRNSICDVCKGRALSAGGYLWSYTKDKKEIDVKASFAKGIKSRRRKKVLPIEKYTLDNKFICLYDNASIAARDVGVHYTNIIKCAKGERRQCAGFIWKYHTL